MQRPTPPGQAEKKKSPLGVIIIILVVLAVIGLAAMIASHIPDTMELERRMDTAATAINADGITALAQAIEAHPRSANRDEARQLVNEMIAVCVNEAVARTDYRTLELFTKVMQENTAWKPYATEENRQLFAAAWQKIIQRMEQEQAGLNEFRAVAARMVDSQLPAPDDVVLLADFKLPPGVAAARQIQIAAAYAAAIVLKAQELADSTLALAEDKEAVKAGTEEPCKECDATGKVACRNCVRNPGKCPNCGGTGKIKVNTFVGRKFETVEQPCPRCEGTGLCAVCKGSGKHECFFCKGTGKRVNSEIAAKTMKEKLRLLIDGIDRQEAELNRLKTQVAR